MNESLYLPATCHQSNGIELKGIHGGQLLLIDKISSNMNLSSPGRQCVEREKIYLLELKLFTSHEPFLLHFAADAPGSCALYCTDCLC